MKTLAAFLLEAVEEALHSAYGEKRKGDLSLAAPQFGHYQCNTPLRIAKEVKEAPRKVAEAIIAHLPEGAKSAFSSIEIAGPGFINFTFSPPFLSEMTTALAKDSRMGVPFPQKPLRIIVEFSSPNIAKELHVGHLRSTIIGDSIARLFEFLGHDVIRLNHVGDFGTQFGMLIAHMQAHAPRVLKGEEEARLEDLMRWYRESKHRFDQDPDFRAKAHQQVVALQAGQEEARNAWEIICEVSRRAFDEIYDLLGVELVERGESFYSPYLQHIVDELQEKGLITISDGAKCVFMDEFVGRSGQKLPLMVQKSDGGFNYDTTDMAAIKYRIFHDKAERIICVTDLGQQLHFQMVFRAAELAGWLDRTKVEVNHVGFGLVLSASGKKFKTRSGETERLIDLLIEAVDQARSLLIERLPVSPPEEIDHLAKVIGIGAVKYSDLSCQRTRDYTFSYERMLRFDGNTAVFLLYAHVRIQGIVRKVREKEGNLPKEGDIALTHPSELALAFHLHQFAPVLEAFSRDLTPSSLTEYLYELAVHFNAFFRDCRVEGSAEEVSRLQLSQATGKVLAQGLHLLGIEAVDRM